ncbi:MAG: hypothetical protein LPJ91_05055 [Pseudazoarcus pumilus]|nr:hypothetical protein [Pseudazoarcus pumilus]
MKIESAQIAMQSSHLAYERERVSVSIERWGPTPPQAASPAPAAVDAAEIKNEDGLDDPRLLLLLTMIEKMLGRSIHLLRLSELEGEAANTYSPPPVAQAAAAADGAGMSMSMRAERMEYERVEFAASGVVRTADGREIRFDVAFEMERSFSERVALDIESGTPRRLKDPLMLDFAGSGAMLSDVRFAFDLDADGELDELPLPVGGRGMLAFDRNGNGRIDDGRELFGPTSGNGFAELAALDSDGNGWIDEADPAFRQLRLWQPDADGEGSMMTLTEAGVGALPLARLATPFALRNSVNETLGEMRQSGVYLNEDGSVGTLSQIDLSV